MAGVAIFRPRSLPAADDRERRGREHLRRFGFPASTGASILTDVGTDPDIAAWVDPAMATIDTPFVELPSLLTGRCVAWDGRNWLEVTVHGDPRDPRADDIGGDLTPEWGSISSTSTS